MGGQGKSECAGLLCVVLALWQCKEGWYGVDCSTPSAAAARQLLSRPPAPPGPLDPQWLQGLKQGQDQVTPPQGDGQQAREPLPVVRAVRRPLIYVYDVSRVFTSSLLEVCLGCLSAVPIPQTFLESTETEH